MMEANELRIGNYVDLYGTTAIVCRNDFDTGELKGLAVDSGKPIPLTEEWLLKLPKKLKYPEWIKSVHELQNWYYWNNNKKELEFKK